MKIILLNGPPTSGKDTIAAMLHEHGGASRVHLEKFANPIKQAVRITYGIPTDVWEELDSGPGKELPQPCFFGKSPRQVQMSFSEDWLKVIHGKEVFGQLLVNRLTNLPPPTESKIVVVSDSGFIEEAKILARAFQPKNIFLWRVHSPGCGYAGDTRSYISGVDPMLREIDVHNEKPRGDGSNRSECLAALERKVSKLFDIVSTEKERVQTSEGTDVETEEQYQERVSAAWELAKEGASHG